VLSVATVNSVNGNYSAGINTLTTNQYEYRDGAVQSRIIHDINTEDSHNPSTLSNSNCFRANCGCGLSVVR
jgi:hypothetical protein